MSIINDPSREFAVEVVRRLKEAGYEALWAGGCVRDFLLGREPGDYDVATDARPEDVRNLFGHRRTLAVGASFGVIIVRGPKGAGQVEVATFRTEGPYLDGRRPASVAFTTPQEDAKRRDFTINGMFYDPVEQKVLDFVGGEQDLGRRIVRAIGDPQARMREDKLRMLRAVRFTATLEFELDPATADAIRRMADEIQVVSSERIAQELRRMLVDPHRMRAMELARDVGLVHVIFSELAPVLGASPDAPPPEPWERTLRMLGLLQDPDFEPAAATLLHAASSPSQPDKPADEAAREICRRLRLSNDETDRIAWLVGHQDELADAPHWPPARLKRMMAHRYFFDLLALTRVKRLAMDADLTPVVFCEEFLHHTPREEIDPPPLITGNELIALGLKPGAQFKEILEAVRDAQLGGEITTKDEALELANRLAEGHGGSD